MAEKKRIIGLDIARILLVLTLPFIHIMEFWGDMYGFADMLSSNATSILNNLCEALCIFVAPSFMICMGINMSLTRKSSYQDFVKRGITLLIVEIILNILRYEIPGFISLFLAKSVEAKEFIGFAMRLGSINSDILALAGFVFIVYGIFKKYNCSPRTIFIISVVCYLIDFGLNETILPSIAATMNSDLANLLGNFIYIDGNSTFPILEWLMYIITGYSIGLKIKDIDEEKRNKLFQRIFFMSLIVFGICFTIAIIYTDNPIASLNKSGLSRSMTPLCLVGEISASLLFISSVYLVSNLLKLKDNDKIYCWASKFSSNITYFYCVQWIIVGSGMMLGIALLYGSKIISLGGVIIIYILICIISYYLGDWIHTKTKNINI